MSFSLKKSDNNLIIGKFSSFSRAGIIHGVSTRRGGTSKPPFDALNLALHVGDDPESVVLNRRLFISALGIDFSRVTTAQQIHGDRIFRVAEPDAGRGRADYADSIPGTDALITNVPRLPLLLCFADCTPVFIADTARRAVAVSHSGWKGTLKNIAAKTIAAMNAAYGTNAADCIAATGPVIGACCYEVGEEVAALFQKEYPDFAEEIIAWRDGRPHLDLDLAVRRQLESAGIPPDNIESAGICTADNTGDFYSYRAEGGRTGRFAAVIAVAV